jgi:hypothetical protein
LINSLFVLSQCFQGFQGELGKPERYVTLKELLQW